MTDPISDMLTRIRNAGRALLPTDAPYLTQITTPTQAGAALGMRDVLMNVVASDTFRMRRGDTSTPTASTGAMP